MNKKIVEFLYNWSSKINAWSWQKLYGNRQTGIGYKRIATSKYKFNEWIKGYKKWKKDDEQ